MRKKIKEGDIFKISYLEDQFLVGQIIKIVRSNIHIIVFDKIYNKDENVDFDKILENKISISTTTLPTFFKLGRWSVINNLQPLEENKYIPKYKIETNDGVFLSDLKGNIIRELSSQEENFFFFQNCFSPASVVSGIKAYYSVIEMDDYYNKMTFDFVSKRCV